MERVQPGARGSSVRNIEMGESVGQFSPGWIVPADEPTRSAQRFSSLDEEEFEAFDAEYDGDSMEVTIQPGEAYVDGWLATDESNTVELDADETNVIVLGWDASAFYDEEVHDTRDEADRIIMRLERNFPDDEPRMDIWEFDTDDDGVTEARDLRNIGPDILVETAEFEEAMLVPKFDTFVEAPEEPRSIIYITGDDEDEEGFYRWNPEDEEYSGIGGMEIETFDDLDNAEKEPDEIVRASGDGPQDEGLYRYNPVRDEWERLSADEGIVAELSQLYTITQGGP